MSLKDVYVKVEITLEEETSGAVKCELEVEPEPMQAQDISYSAQGGVWIEIKQEPKDEPVPSDDEISHLCKICLRTFELQTTLLNHSCEPEERTNLKQEVFTEPLKTHTHEDAYQCDTCKEMFASKSILINHIQTHKERTLDSKKPKDLTCAVSDKPLKSCQICKKQFKLKANLTEHIRTHTGEKPYSCPICNKQFTRKATSNKHFMRAHLKEQPFPSQFSGQRSIDKSNLTKNIQINTKEKDTKPHCCLICNKEYSEKRYLIKHERFHQTDKLLPCQVCNSKFPYKSDLVRHMLVHTEERPFSCQICSKQFSDKFVLAKHVRIHSGVKPHCCQTCQKTFTEKSSLVRHMQTHTGEKRYCCQTCNKQFSDRSSVSRHALKRTCQSTHRGKTTPM